MYKNKKKTTKKILYYMWLAFVRGPRGPGWGAQGFITLQF